MSFFRIHDGATDRKINLKMVEKVSYPVLSALSRDELKQVLVQEKTPHRPDNTSSNAYAEAFARSLLGIAPWLNLGPDDTEEGQMRKEYLDIVVKAFDNFNDPKAKDYIKLNGGGQKLVEAAFISLSLLQSPIIWDSLSNTTKANLEANLRVALHDSGKYKNNWVLFPATVEAALHKYTTYNTTKWMEEGINLINSWYKGDGMYGDGTNFHNDYYNSLVMHPLLTACVEYLKSINHALGKKYSCFMKRSARYAEVCTCDLEVIPRSWRDTSMPMPHTPLLGAQRLIVLDSSTISPTVLCATTWPPSKQREPFAQLSLLLWRSS